MNIRQRPSSPRTTLPVQVARSSNPSGCGARASASRVQCVRSVRDGVPDRRVDVAQVGVAERARRLQEEQVVRRLRGRRVVDDPEVPDPVVAELEHEAGQPTAVARSTSALSGASTGSRTPTEPSTLPGTSMPSPSSQVDPRSATTCRSAGRVLAGDPVGPGRVEAGQQHGGRRLGDEGVDGRHDVPGLGGVLGDGARHDQGRVGVVAAHQPAGREHRPDPLVQGHPGRDLGGGVRRRARAGPTRCRSGRAGPWRRGSRAGGCGRWCARPGRRGGCRASRAAPAGRSSAGSAAARPRRWCRSARPGRSGSAPRGRSGRRRWRRSRSPAAGARSRSSSSSR